MPPDWYVHKLANADVSQCNAIATRQAALCVCVGGGESPPSTSNVSPCLCVYVTCTLMSSIYRCSACNVDDVPRLSAFIHEALACGLRRAVLGTVLQGVSVAVQCRAAENRLPNWPSRARLASEGFWPERGASCWSHAALGACPAQALCQMERKLRKKAKRRTQ